MATDDRTTTATGAVERRALDRPTVLAGGLLLAGVLGGLASVVPVLEQPGYLTELPAREGELVRGALAQVLMVPAYAGFALALHGVVARAGRELAAGFLAFRMVGAAFLLLGALLLPALAELARAADAAAGPEAIALADLTEVLRIGRDLVNHVAVIIPVSLADALLFAALLRSRRMPRWLGIWGLAGCGLAAAASLLVLAGLVPVVDALYLGLNAPLAVHSLVLGLWLIVTGVRRTSALRRGDG